MEDYGRIQFLPQGGNGFINQAAGGFHFSVAKNGGDLLVRLAFEKIQEYGFSFFNTELIHGIPQFKNLCFTKLAIDELLFIRHFESEFFSCRS